MNSLTGNETLPEGRVKESPFTGNETTAQFLAITKGTLTPATNLRKWEFNRDSNHFEILTTSGETLLLTASTIRNMAQTLAEAYTQNHPKTRHLPNSTPNHR